MVEKFKQLITKIIQEKGPANLFAVLKMDNLTDKWTVILSAPWIQEDTFAYIRNELIHTFTSEEMATIAKLGVFPKSVHIVEELLKYNEGATINEDQQINGNLIHEAYILISNPNL